MDADEDFQYTVTTSRDRATVAVQGDLDAATGPRLSAAVSALTTDGLAGVVVDLDRVSFVDSRGLSALLESHRAVTGRDMTFTVVNLKPAIQRLFRITGVQHVLLDGDTPS